jgi:LacI family transcriptional regulator
MIKKFTIKDIAELAGVSKGTVDRVLHKRGRVSEDALKKVTDILDQIDYHPNPIAKTLKSNKVYHFSLIIPDATQDSFWSPCLNAVKEVKRKYQNFGISIQTHSYASNDAKSFYSTCETVIESCPDALLIAPLFYKEACKIADICESKNIQLMTFNNTLKRDKSLNFVGQDLFKSGRIAAKLFDTILDKGNITIAHIDQDFDNATHMQAKEKGFRNYFEEVNKKGFHIDTFYGYHNNLQKSIQELTNHICNKNTNGLFITTSKTYISEEIKTIYKNNLKVIGYDLIKKNTNLLKEGVIDFLIHQNPQHQTFIGLSQLAEFFLFETKIRSETLLPIDIINSENYDQYLE